MRNWQVTVPTLTPVSGPLDRVRKVPAVGVLAERQMGGFLAASAIVGVGVGLATAAFVWMVDRMDHLLGPVLEPLFDVEELGFWDLSRAWIFLTVPLGLLVAWWVAKRFAPEVAGDGVPEAIAALEVHGGRMRKRVIPLKLIATAITVGSGGSAGRETWAATAVRGRGRADDGRAAPSAAELRSGLLLGGQLLVDHHLESLEGLGAAQE